MLLRKPLQTRMVQSRTRKVRTPLYNKTSFIVIYDAKSHCDVHSIFRSPGSSVYTTEGQENGAKIYLFAFLNFKVTG